ncbi:MAG TPA: LPS assembly lipoprotein LptE [Longimicrobiaceae bacterium]
MTRRCVPLAAGLAILAAACNYGFVGGGLPSHVRTVAILPFENETSQPLLETDIQRALQRELPRKLGVRLANQSVADAVVRGAVTSYEEVVSSVRPNQNPTGSSQVPVAQRQVRVVFNAEIYDVRNDAVLWRAQGQSVLGSFGDSENPDAGRNRAIQELVTRFVEGAQSQW